MTNINEGIKDILDGLLIYLSYKHNIEKPKLKIHKLYDNCHYNYLDNEIIIGEKYIFSNTFNECCQPYLSIDLITHFSRLLYCLFHEFGHCLHYIKYPKNFHKVKEQYIQYNSTINSYKEYRSLKLEKIADKIAVYYMKKHYKEYTLDKSI